MSVNTKRTLIRCLGWLFVLAGVTIMIGGCYHGTPEFRSPSPPVGDKHEFAERKERAAWIIHGGAALAVSSALIAFAIDGLLCSGRSTKNSGGSGNGAFAQMTAWASVDVPGHILAAIIVD